MSPTLADLCALIALKFEIDPATIDATRPVAESGLDSLALTELLFAAEDHFGVDLAGHAQGVTTLEALAALIDQKRKGAPARAPLPGNAPQAAASSE